MKCWIVTIALVLMSCSFSFGVELDIKKALFDKGLIDKVDWNNTKKYFNKKPSSSEHFKSSPSYYDYYDTITLEGRVLKVGLYMDKVKDKTPIVVMLPENKEGEDTYIKDVDVSVVLGHLNQKFGENFKLYKKKLSFSEKDYITFDTYEWTTNKSTIQFDTMQTKNGTSSKYLTASIRYDSTQNTKPIEPVKFIECTYDMIFSDGDKRGPKNLILGIDYNDNTIVTKDYLKSIFSMNGDYIVSNTENDGGVSSLEISRTSGKLTGNFKYKNISGTYSGTCVVQSDKKLF